MSAPACLVTGSSGLVGSEVCAYLSARGAVVHGIDNNERAVFFGPPGDTAWNRERLQRTLRYCHHSVDIRNRSEVTDLVRTIRPALIVHAAAQPSHDRAASIPFDDFETNALGTLNLLEAARAYSPDSPFAFMSTNKGYGDMPNSIAMRELATRWDYADEAFEQGIAETLSVDHSTHSLFEVYNIGGGKANSCSVLEAFDIVESITGRAQRWVYDETARRDDHICYFSDLRKAKLHYREWSVSTSLRDTVREIVSTWNERHCVR
jgi:nucleoside-diphosphate-sugar epimerase